MPANVCRELARACASSSSVALQLPAASRASRLDPRSSRRRDRVLRRDPRAADADDVGQASDRPARSSASMPPVGQKRTAGSGEANAFSVGDAAGRFGGEEFLQPCSRARAAPSPRTRVAVPGRNGSAAPAAAVEQRGRRAGRHGEARAGGSAASSSWRGRQHGAGARRRRPRTAAAIGADRRRAPPASAA